MDLRRDARDRRERRLVAAGVRLRGGRPRPDPGGQLLTAGVLVVRVDGRRPRRGTDQHGVRIRLPRPSGPHVQPTGRDRRRRVRPPVRRRRRGLRGHRAVLGHRHRPARRGRRDVAGPGLGGAAVRRPAGPSQRRAARRQRPRARRHLLHVRHHRAVQGCRDAPLAVLLRRLRERRAHPAHPGRRLHGDDAALPRERAVAGRIPGPRRRCAVRAPPQVQRQPVGRLGAPEPGHGHQLPRRDDGLRLEAAGARRTTRTTRCAASSRHRRPAASSTASGHGSGSRPSSRSSG